MGFKRSHEPPQRCDHGGSYVSVPRSLLSSAAWIDLGSRGRCIVLALCARFSGYNNGAIPISIEEIGQALGNQNHGANSKALARAIDLGIVECMVDANHHQGRAREYRLTFIETGPPKARVPATHEYRSHNRTREKKGQFFAAQSAGKSDVSTAEITASSKLSAEDFAGSGIMESSNLGVLPPVGTSALIFNHPCGSQGHIRGGREGALVSPGDLREWTRLVVASYGHGTQRQMARDAAISEPSLSKFLHGRGLPERHRASLQMACSRYVPYDQRESYREDLGIANAATI